jgi:single-strand DNA-binding protein
MSAIANRVQLIGQLGQNPETKKFENGSRLARFTMATNDVYKNASGEKVKETQWHNVVAWGKTADILEKYVKKGDRIAVEGKITSRSYDDKDGQKKYFTEIIANEIMLLGSKSTEK